MTQLPTSLLSPGPQAVRLPTDEGGPVRFGLAVIIISFGLLFGWSALAPLAKGVIAPGSVVVDGNRKAIQHLEGGIVTEILVRDGDMVEEGQVLLRLDEVTPQAQRDILYVQYLMSSAQLARLVAERDDLPAIAFPSDLMEPDETNRRASIRASEEQIFTSRRVALSGQLSILEQRIAQLEKQITGLRAQMEANDEQVRLINTEIEGLAQLFEKGYASRTRLLELERRRAELTGERGALEAESARAGVAIGEARLQIVQLRKAFEEEVAQQLQEVQVRVYDLQDRLTSATDVLQRREVRAPTAGIVVGSRVHTIGGVINAGQLLMEVVPTHDDLTVEVMVSPMDIDAVTVGMESEVRFSGLPHSQTPMLFGKVTRVGADITTDQQGNSYYIARVQVPPEEMEKIAHITLIPGMPAEVLIKAGERTLFEYLTRPLTDSFFKAFKEV